MARRLLLHLFSIGEGVFYGPSEVTPFSKPGAGVTWIKSGQGQLQFDETQWELAPGPDFWLYGTEHTRVFTPTTSKQLVAQAFWFSGPGLEAWLEMLDVNRNPQFRLPNPACVYQAYRKMLGLARRQPPNWEWKIHSLITSVLGEFLLARRLLTPAQDALPAPIAQVLNAIETDPVRDWKTSELAALAGMSYTAFRILFRDTLHESPHTYLQRARLNLARDMLSDPDLRIKEIARRLHFSSEYYFSNFFRQHTGFSPTEFRRHQQHQSPDTRKAPAA